MDEVDTAYWSNCTSAVGYYTYTIFGVTEGLDEDGEVLAYVAFEGVVHVFFNVVYIELDIVFVEATCWIGEVYQLGHHFVWDLIRVICKFKTHKLGIFNLSWEDKRQQCQ